MSELKDRLLNHERHNHIRFYEDEHEYFYYPSGDFRKTKERVEFNGVTSWIKQFCSKFNADKTIDKYYDYWQRSDHEDYGGLSKDEIKGLWANKGNDARDKGNVIHKAIEELVNLGVYDEDNSFYIDRFLDCMDEQGIEPFVSEIVVYDEDVQRATAIDVVGIKDGKLFPMDIKTFEDGMQFVGYKNKKMKHPLGGLNESKYDKVSLQVSLPRIWLNKHYGFDEDEIQDGAVLVLNDDGCQFIPLLDYREDALKMYNY